MPKTYTAQNIQKVDGIHFNVDAVGNVTGMDVACEVNFGSFGKTEQVDVYPDLNAGQQALVQNIYDALLSLLTSKYVE